MHHLVLARSSAHKKAVPRSNSTLLRCFGTTFALCLSAMATASPLSLDQARQIALERSRQLVAQDHAVAASRDMASAAAQLPDPLLKVGVDNFPVSGPDRFRLTAESMTMRRAGIMQELTRSDKRQLRAARFEREAEKTMAEKAFASANIERDTSLAWLDRYYAESSAKLISELTLQAKLEIDAADGAYRGARGSRAELLAARSAVALYEDRASEAERKVRNASAVLSRWVGSAGAGPLGAKPALDEITLDPATLQTQLTHLPQVAILAKQEQIASTDAQLAQANQRADWSVEVTYQQRASAFGNMISLGLSVPLQWDRKNRQNRELSASLAVVEQAKAEREEALRGYVAETGTMLTEWHSNRARSVRFEREILPLARERTAAILAAYRGATASLTDVLAARRSEIDVRLQALQLEADTARLWAQLHFLIPQSSRSAVTGTTMKRAQDEK